MDIFEQFKLVNRVTESTHIKGGTLDLIVSTHNLPTNHCKIFPSGTFSDHSLINVGL